MSNVDTTNVLSTTLPNTSIKKRGTRRPPEVILLEKQQKAQRRALRATKVETKKIKVPTVSDKAPEKTRKRRLPKVPAPALVPAEPALVPVPAPVPAPTPPQAIMTLKPLQKTIKRKLPQLPPKNTVEQPTTVVQPTQTTLEAPTTVAPAPVLKPLKKTIKRKLPKLDIGVPPISAAPAPAAAAPVAAAEEETFLQDNDNAVVINNNKNKLELQEHNDFLLSNTDNSYNFLYPSLNDPNFNIKIAERKEFNDTQYGGEIKENIEEHADKLCNADFELAPHQLFIRNFLSFQTPYNSLLLYHGLGSGKTCSAISVAEEMRDYIMQMGINSKIIIVASPNVQANFRLQLFDERKLKEIDGVWNIRACTGNKLLKEINPMNMKGLTRDNVIKQINSLINTYYDFFGYVEFANEINNKGSVENIPMMEQKQIERMMESRLKRAFNNRLIIIDEVHNIRVSDDTKVKRVAEELKKLVKYVDNLRLLLLSATPMFNSYKEIIWLINLMNMNDRRATISEKDVFTKNGDFKEAVNDEESGKELLIRKSTGYISFVRGENPYTFPYRLFPTEFSPENTFPQKPYPTIQLNGTTELKEEQQIKYISLYLSEIGEYQQLGYNYIVRRLKGNAAAGNEGNAAAAAGTTFQLPTAENMESFGYTMLQQPVEGLNIIYPDNRITPTTDLTTLSFNSHDLIGAEGLKRVMSFTENETTKARTNFKYKNYGPIFAKDEIGKYSNKIKTICDLIVASTGVVLVYSQYIDAGLVPLALALEERGFSRAGEGKSLFDKPPVPKINGFKYVMITGDRGFSPHPQSDIKLSTNDDNKNGEKVKVIMISQTGAEGLDLKCIRQVHILEPWYNMNRIEQIIGRAIRTCSHKSLPFIKRNVEIYLHGTLLRPKDELSTGTGAGTGAEESVDLYIYRLAEAKAIQIGKVSRVLKEIAVDCLLHRSQMNFTEENIKTEVTLELANGTSLPNYKIGDKPRSAICDYMESCTYECTPNKEEDEMVINTDSYNEDFIMMNADKLVNNIKQLMKERYFYRRRELIALLNILKPNPEDQINAALQHLIEDKNEYITDQYGRLGHLINIDDLYLFQPLELTNKRASIFDRQTPLDLKHEKITVKMPKIIPAKRDAVKTQRKILQPVAEAVEGEDTDAEGVAAEAAAAAEDEIALLDEIRNNYNAVNTPPLPAAVPAAEIQTDESNENIEKSWYTHCALANKWMIEKNTGIDRELLMRLVVEHIVDDLTLTDIEFLLNHIEKNKTTLYETDDILKQVKTYILNQMVEGNKKMKGFLWHKQDTQIVFVKPEKAETWTLAKSEDMKDLKQKLDEKKTKILSNLNTNIGFMLNFKKANYNVFKTKDITKPRDLGARCDQHSNKKNALALLNTIIGEKKYSTTDKIKASQKDICIIQELYLRMFNRAKKNNKYWFLTPAESILTNIEKYSSTK